MLTVDFYASFCSVFANYTVVMKVLYLSNNQVKSWSEFDRLKELENLQEVLMVGNPLWKTHDEAGDWKMQVCGGVLRNMQRP